MHRRTLDQWLAWLEGFHPRAIDLGLERVGAVAARMGVAQLPCPVITVAGTNGKGSCVAMLESILSTAGYRVAGYTSPHLLRYNERVRLAGSEASDDQLCAAFEHVDEARGDISLSYFEFGTLGALDLFVRDKPDVAVLEVGLGGRLDAVNVVDCDIAIVTSIGLDHTEWLGTDRDAIGVEKAGIFRGGKPAVCADPDPPASLIRAAAAAHVPLYVTGRDFGAEHARGDAAGWSWWSCEKRIAGLPTPGLPGRFQYHNAAAVLMALTLLGERFAVSDAALAAGLAAVRINGRYQQLPGTVIRILDVAHNPDGVRALAGLLAEQSFSGVTIAVTAMLGDKNIDVMISSMSEIVDEWHVATLANPRAAPAARLQSAVAACSPETPVHAHPDVRAGYLCALSRARPGDRIVVFGSFYTVGEVLQLEQQRQITAEV